MNVHHAHLALEESLRRPSATPCTWRPDRDAYIAEEVAKLRDRLIEPTQVQAQASEWAHQFVGQSNKVRRFVAIARSAERWLLFDEHTATFALAYGSHNQSEETLTLLGFESTDALAEWLG